MCLTGWLKSRWLNSDSSSVCLFVWHLLMNCYKCDQWWSYTHLEWQISLDLAVTPLVYPHKRVGGYTGVSLSVGPSVCRLRITQAPKALSEHHRCSCQVAGDSDSFPPTVPHQWQCTTAHCAPSTHCAPTLQCVRQPSDYAPPHTVPHQPTLLHWVEHHAIY